MKKVFTLILLISTLSGYAQIGNMGNPMGNTQNVSGNQQNSGTSALIVYSKNGKNFVVYLNGIQISTNYDNKFRVTNLKPGSYEVRIIYQENQVQPIVQKINLIANQEQTIALNQSVPNQNNSTFNPGNTDRNAPNWGNTNGGNGNSGNMGNGNVGNPTNNNNGGSGSTTGNQGNPGNKGNGNVGNPTNNNSGGTGNAAGNQGNSGNMGNGNVGNPTNNNNGGPGNTAGNQGNSGNNGNVGNPNNNGGSGSNGANNSGNNGYSNNNGGYSNGNTGNGNMGNSSNNNGYNNGYSNNNNGNNGYYNNNGGNPSSNQKFITVKRNGRLVRILNPNYRPSSYSGYYDQNGNWISTNGNEITMNNGYYYRNGKPCQECCQRQNHPNGYVVEIFTHSMDMAKQSMDDAWRMTNNAMGQAFGYGNNCIDCDNSTDIQWNGSGYQDNSAYSNNPNYNPYNQNYDQSQNYNQNQGYNSNQGYNNNQNYNQNNNQNYNQNQGYNNNQNSSNVSNNTGYVNGQCYGAVNSNDFMNLKKAIISKDFESTKLSVAKELVDNRCFTAAQIEEIMRSFDFESSKLDIAKYAYLHCVDRSNYYQLYDAFDFDASITELQNYTKGK